MSEAMALRLDEGTRARLGRIARRRGTSRSAIVREAIVAFVENEERQEAVSPFDRVKDLIGSIDGGDPLRSEGGGARVAELLRRKRERR